MTAAAFRNMSEVSSVSAHSLQERLRPFTNAQAYNALLKAYCSIQILTIPKAYGEGGWLIGTLSLFFSAIVSLICAVKLIECSFKTKLVSYPQIVRASFGLGAETLVKIWLAVYQFNWTVIQLNFTIESLGDVFGIPKEIKWYFIVAIMILYSPLAWVRQLQYYSPVYLAGNIIIFFVCFTLMVKCLKLIHTSGSHSEIQPIENSGIISTVCVSLFFFEGIGSVMPIMKQTRNRHDFKQVTTYAILTLAIFFAVFSTLCYLYLGKDQT